jgi:hypothetical protein
MRLLALREAILSCGLASSPPELQGPAGGARGEAMPAERNAGSPQSTGTSSPPERSEGWQPIDSAPKDGRFVLLFSACRAPRFAQNVGKWRDTHGEWYSLDMHVVIDPTHWMPLPAPPEISNG